VIIAQQRAQFHVVNIAQQMKDKNAIITMKKHLSTYWKRNYEESDGLNVIKINKIEIISPKYSPPSLLLLSWYAHEDWNNVREVEGPISPLFTTHQPTLGIYFSISPLRRATLIIFGTKEWTDKSKGIYL
jgi:hypothetical protein